MDENLNNNLNNSNSNDLSQNSQNSTKDQSVTKKSLTIEERKANLRFRLFVFLCVIAVILLGLTIYAIIAAVMHL